MVNVWANNGLSRKEALDLLRQWRENNERKSNEVLELYTTYDMENLNNNNERLMILEQVIYAALDCHDYAIASSCIAALQREFPWSKRVMRHQAALLEAQEKYDEALEILDNIIKADETNSAARKRRIAILKEQGQTVEAIRELVDYLKKFMSDAEGWQQLCALYLSRGELSRAVFCAEELLLHQPHCHLRYQAVADIRYTMGGVENLDLAKSFYCQTLNLNPDNMRATLGLFLTTSTLLTHYKSSGNSARRKDAFELSQWAQSRAAHMQAEAKSPADLTDMLLSLAITE